MQERVTRVSYNNQGWRRPSYRSPEEADSLYVQQTGFGHEDWLFRDEWLIGGWRYAFLQGINKSRASLVRELSSINITLFTEDPVSRRRSFVAHIENLEPLTRQQAEIARQEFERKGWLQTMRADIRDAKGKPEALGDGNFAEDILNVRFRLSSLTRFPADSFIPNDDPLVAEKRRFTRFSLFKMPNVSIQSVVQEIKSSKRRVGVLELPTSKSIEKHTALRISEITFEHLEIQHRLLQELRVSFPHATVLAEENFVDLLVDTGSELTLYEIKSDLNASTVMRSALGQLLEYAHLQRRASLDRVRLVAVGRSPMTQTDRDFLKFLQDSIQFPISYRQIAI